MSVRLATHMRLILWPSLLASYSIHSMLGVLGLRPSNLSPKPSMEVFQPSYQAYGSLWIHFTIQLSIHPPPHCLSQSACIKSICVPSGRLPGAAPASAEEVDSGMS